MLTRESRFQENKTDTKFSSDKLVVIDRQKGAISVQHTTLTYN